MVDGGLTGADASDRSVRARFIVSSALAEVQTVAFTAGSCAPDSLATVSKQCDVDRRASKERQLRLQAVLDKYNLEIGSGLVDQCGRVVPSIASRALEFEAKPHPRLQHLLWRPTGVKERVTRAMKMPKTSQLAKDLFSLFETAWAGSHTSVQGDAGTRQRMLDNPPERRPCCDAGMCICDAAGKQLCIMRKAFDRHLAKVCCPGSRHRKQLVDCELVVFFVGRSRELIATAGGLADGASADSSDHRGELLVGHISDQSISPWQTWFQKGSTDHPFDFKSLRFDVETVRIQIKGEFWRRYFWLQQLDRSLHWGMLVFEVVWKATMLGTLLPDTLDLRCIAGQDEPLVIWDPFTKKGRKRKKDPKAWAKTLAEASDSSSAAGDAAHESDVSDDAAEVEPEPLEDDEPEGIDSDGNEESASEDAALDLEADDDEEAYESVDELSDLVGGVLGGSPVAAPSADGGESDPSTGSSSSSSSSSSDSGNGSMEEGDGPPPLPPPPPPPEGGDGRRSHDFFRINEWTTITYFELDNRRDFIAKCRYPGHNSCILTRTANASSWANKTHSGRPLGGMVAFCRSVESGAVPNKAAHMRAIGEPDLAARLGHRDWFSAFPDTAFFLGKERPRREGEGTEPDIFT